MIRRPPRSTLFPTRRSSDLEGVGSDGVGVLRANGGELPAFEIDNPIIQNLDFRVELSLLLRSEEHTSELQSQSNLVCRLLLEKKKKNTSTTPYETTNK